MIDGQSALQDHLPSHNKQVMIESSSASILLQSEYSMKSVPRSSSYSSRPMMAGNVESSEDSSANAIYFFLQGWMCELKPKKLASVSTKQIRTKHYY
jgi:hypothetical protein